MAKMILQIPGIRLGLAMTHELLRALEDPAIALPVSDAYSSCTHPPVIPLSENENG